METVIDLIATTPREVYMKLGFIVLVLLYAYIPDHEAIRDKIRGK